MTFSFLTFPAATDVWLPLGMDPFEGRRFARGARAMGVLGRLKDDTTIARAASEAETIAARLAAAYPRFNSGRQFSVVALHEQVVRGIRTAALVLLAAVSLVLVIACANVASLLLARATSRHSELAIRAALGASRWRLMRHQIAESAVSGRPVARADCCSRCGWSTCSSRSLTGLTACSSHSPLLAGRFTSTPPC